MIKISSSILVALFISLSYSGCSTKQDEVRKMIEIDKQEKEAIIAQEEQENDKIVEDIAGGLNLDWKNPKIVYDYKWQIYQKALGVNKLSVNEYDPERRKESLLKLKTFILDKKINTFQMLTEATKTIEEENRKEENRLEAIKQAEENDKRKEKSRLEDIRQAKIVEEQAANYIKYGIQAIQKGEYQKRIDLLQKSCDSNNTNACFVVGGINKMMQNYPDAVKFYDKACTGGNQNGCSALGEMYDKGAGVGQDSQMAATLFTKACTGGSAEGCNNLGSMFYNGQGMQKDDAQAASYFKKACDGGVALGCYSFGNMSLKGEGVQTNPTKAVELYQKACTSGEVNGCFDLGAMYYNGNNVKKDKKNALQYFKKACDLKDAEGCQNYAMIKKELGK